MLAWKGRPFLSSCGENEEIIIQTQTFPELAIEVVYPAGARQLATFGTW